MQKLWMRGLPSLSLIGGPAEGQVVVVTGPTSGIGRETAAALAARGSHGEFAGAGRPRPPAGEVQEAMRRCLWGAATAAAATASS